MHEFFTTAPFDLYELQLFRLVVTHRNFTRAAAAAGLTQSALTRQIQDMEKALQVRLLERTTRSVAPTAAGEFLSREGARLLDQAEESWQRLREEFAAARPQVRVGVSQSIGLAYLPGFLHANLRRQPQVACRVSAQPDAALLTALESNELDLAILPTPARLPRTLRATYRFADAFTLLASREAAAAFQLLPKAKKSRRAWLERQPWLLLEQTSSTGAALRLWLHQQELRSEPAMQLDTFDLIINLVALGLGLSVVPIRALALYGRKHTLHRLPWPQRFEREIVVVVRKHRQFTPHLAAFVENVLF